MQDCQIFLAENENDQDEDQQCLKKKALADLQLTNPMYVVNWAPAIVMLFLAEMVNYYEWSGSSSFYMPLLIMNGLTVCYRTLKLKGYYRRPSTLDVH